MAKFSQYRVFTAVVETNGISSAARLLNYSPSAVSKQLTALEDRVNVQLVDRSNRTVKITDPGKIFYRQCKDILSRVAEAENILLSTTKIVSGKIALTMSKSLARSTIFDVLSKFSKQNSAIRYNIELSDDIKDLYETDNDFAFRLGKIHDSTSLIAIPLYEVRLIFCATPQYVQKHGMLKSFDELENHHLILLSAYNYSDVMRNFFKRENIDMNKVTNHNTNDIEAVYQSVRSGLSIGMMLDVSIQHELKNNIFVDIFPTENLPSKKLFLVYKKSTRFSQKHEAFKEFIKLELSK